MAFALFRHRPLPRLPEQATALIFSYHWGIFLRGKNELLLFAVMLELVVSKSFETLPQL
jgi:hypothetical protein